MNRRTILRNGALAASTVVSGCVGTFATSDDGPRKPGAYWLDSDEPIVEGAPSSEDEGDYYGTILTSRKEADERLNPKVYPDDEAWNDVDYESKFVSVNSMALPADRQLTTETAELRDRTYVYEGRVAPQTSTGKGTYVTNLLLKWTLNGRPKPETAEMTIVE